MDPWHCVQRLNQAFVEALNSPELRARMATLLAEPMPTTPAQFGAFVKSELFLRWRLQRCKRFD